MERDQCRDWWCVFSLLDLRKDVLAFSMNFISVKCVCIPQTCSSQSTGHTVTEDRYKVRPLNESPSKREAEKNPGLSVKHENRKFISCSADQPVPRNDPPFPGIARSVGFYENE